MTEREQFARRPVLLVSAAIGLLLLALSGRYGYHRDELYFIACGHHLAWGFPDQPPLTPLLARLMTAIAPHSLVVLRLPSDFGAALVVLFTGLTARELGARPSAQTLAAGLMAVSGLLLGAFHLLSTTDPDLLVWTVLIWLVLRLMHGADERLWVVAGLVAGIGLLDSDLVAFLVFSLAVGILVSGPRRLFASRWLYVGVVIAAALWTPYLVWQAQHGWPQLSVAHSIAAGNSGTSSPRWALLPQQFLNAGPPVAAFLVVGLVSLCRRPSYRWLRALLVAAVTLFVVVTASGGKAYYLGGLYPLLFAASAQPTVEWIDGRRRRAGWVVAAFAGSAVTMAIALPMLPLSKVHSSGVVALNYDAGETIGWPAMTRQVAAVYDSLSAAQRARTVILGSNYGEAGAVDRYGPALGLPSAYSGHNAYYLWGPPPSSATTAVAIGFSPSDLEQDFVTVRVVAHLDNGHGVDDDEQGAPVALASQLRRPWPEIWRRLKYYG